MNPKLHEKDEKYYRYTGIDEYTRIKYIMMLRYFRKEYDIEIKTIQTDNKFEFANRISWQGFLKNKKILLKKH